MSSTSSPMVADTSQRSLPTGQIPQSKTANEIFGCDGYPKPLELSQWMQATADAKRELAASESASNLMAVKLATAERRVAELQELPNQTELNAELRAGAGGGTLPEESAVSTPLHQRIVQHRCERLTREGKIIAEVRAVLTAHEAVKASQDSNESRGSVPLV